MAMRQRAATTVKTDPIFDLGPDLPVRVTTRARDAALKLPQKALSCLMGEIAGWAEAAPISAAKATYYVDYEDPSWRYVLIEFLVDTPSTLTDDPYAAAEYLVAQTAVMNGVIDDAMGKLSARDRKRLDDSLNFDLASRDHWDDNLGDRSAEL
jgi:hypothetical protein